jgi:hypothetical protein
MGADSTLVIGKLEVDWGRNDFWRNHGDLFQPLDLTKLRYPSYSSRKKYEALRRPLRLILPRLDLLGHSIANARLEYDQLLLSTEDVTADHDTSVRPSFDDLAKLLSRVDVLKVSKQYGEGHDHGEFFAEDIAPRIGLHGKPWSLKTLGDAIEYFSATSVLRLLAENPANLDHDVIWYFNDHIDMEYATLDDFVRPVTRDSRFLIVTEGSSDAKVIAKALELRRPEIADFFYFVDMEREYPFTGTGNLHRFVQGLVSIDLTNKVVVVYDNDAEGVSGFMRSSRLKLSDNIRVMRLPDLSPGLMFPTLGPDGAGRADINRRAASIEAYLDLTASDDRTVRWTNYVEAVDSYQGSLLRKDQILRSFLELDESTRNEYDFNNLDRVLDQIVSECAQIASKFRAPILPAY